MTCSICIARLDIPSSCWVECVLLSAESFLVSFINTVDNGIVMLLEIRIESVQHLRHPLGKARCCRFVNPTLEVFQSSVQAGDRGLDDASSLS